jgi:cell wall-associated NlpC family hydrolase
VGRLRAGLLIGATTALTFTMVPGTASAEPERASTTAEAAQLVASASRELEIVSEELNEAKVQLERQQAAVASAELAAYAADVERAALDGRIRELARTAYTGGGRSLTQLDVMLTSDSVDDFIFQMGTLDALAGRNNAAVGEVAEAAARAEDARAEAGEARKTAEASLEQIEVKQRDLEVRIADYQRQFEALDAAERAAAERAAADRVQAEEQLVRASRSERTAPSSSAGSSSAGSAPAAPAPRAAVAPSGAAQVAVDTALAQVGDRYVWGAGGPDAFDCSGLTSFAYRAAGISLPHSSRSQSQMGRPVSRGELQPGDLLFFYSPVSHVAMYIGGGKMVHASTSSQPVKVDNVDSFPSYNSARRLVG